MGVMISNEDPSANSGAGNKTLITKLKPTMSKSNRNTTKVNKHSTENFPRGGKTEIKTRNRSKLQDLDRNRINLIQESRQSNTTTN